MDEKLRIGFASEDGVECGEHVDNGSKLAVELLLSIEYTGCGVEQLRF